MKLITDNRKSRFNYKIEETFEAGIILKGTEVKSCRDNRVNLSDGYCAFRGDELFLQNVHISEYAQGNRSNHDPRAPRKLLLHRKELDELLGRWNSGYSIVPTKMYFKNSKIKVQIGLGTGKKQRDKRQTIKERQAKREMEREFRR